MKYTLLISNRTARNSKPLEVLGTYDPIPKPPKEGEGKPFKDIKLDTVRAKYWLGVGAQPSDPAWKLLSLVSLFLFVVEEPFWWREGEGEKRVHGWDGMEKLEGKGRGRARD